MEYIGAAESQGLILMRITQVSGKQIRLFSTDGDVDGIRTIEIFNMTINKVTLFPHPMFL